MFKGGFGRFVESAKQLASSAIDRAQDAVRDIQDNATILAGRKSGSVPQEFVRARKERAVREGWSPCNTCSVNLDGLGERRWLFGAAGEPPECAVCVVVKGRELPCLVCGTAFKASEEGQDKRFGCAIVCPTCRQKLNGKFVLQSDRTFRPWDDREQRAQVARDRIKRLKDECNVPSRWLYDADENHVGTLTIVGPVKKGTFDLRVDDTYYISHPFKRAVGAERASGIVTMELRPLPGMAGVFNVHPWFSPKDLPSGQRARPVDRSALRVAEAALDAQQRDARVRRALNVRGGADRSIVEGAIDGYFDARQEEHREQLRAAQCAWDIAKAVGFEFCRNRPDQFARWSPGSAQHLRAVDLLATAKAEGLVPCVPSATDLPSGWPPGTIVPEAAIAALRKS